MKYALVTGASSGIGQAISLKIAAEHGYHVLVNYLGNVEAANAVVKQIQEAGGSAEAMQFDVTDRQQVEAVLNNWWKANNDAPIEVLVNNAGMVKDGLFMLMEEKNWDAVVDVKLKGFFNVTRCVIQKMLLQRYGRIVNIASLIGIHGHQGQVNYAAANGGLIAASKALAKEIAIRNISVNAIAPGYIQTEMTSHIPAETMTSIIPSKRLGTVEEVAELVSFLVSGKAAYINGEVITIGGGL